MEMSKKEMADMQKPRLHLSSKDLPAIKNWEVGEDYEIKLKVRQESMHEDERGGRSATFVIEKCMAEDESEHVKELKERHS